jgi:hypothetical protein
MMGTDTFKNSSSKIVEDPYTGKPICLIPACYPDFAFIHVHRCDKYGNSQIDGTIIEDKELAMAAKRLIVTTEKIISEEEIRSNYQALAQVFDVPNLPVAVRSSATAEDLPGASFAGQQDTFLWVQGRSAKIFFQSFPGFKTQLMKESEQAVQLRHFIILGGQPARHLEGFLGPSRIEETMDLVHLCLKTDVRIFCYFGQLDARLFRQAEIPCRQGKPALVVDELDQGGCRAAAELQVHKLNVQRFRDGPGGTLEARVLDRYEASQEESVSHRIIPEGRGGR